MQVETEYQVFPARRVELEVGDMVSPTDRALRELPHMPNSLGLITEIVGPSGGTQIAYVWWFNIEPGERVRGAPINISWLKVHRAI